MQTIYPPTPDAAQLANLQKKLALENKIKNGIGWFYWIAGLSLLNSAIFLFGSDLTFVIGLGVTQIVDGFMYGVASELGESGIIARLIGFAIDAFISGIFVVFGIFGRKRIRWVIILGMVIYAADGILLLLFQAFLGAAFHAWALVGIWGGLKAIKDLRALEGSQDISAVGIAPN